MRLNLIAVLVATGIATAASAQTPPQAPPAAGQQAEALAKLKAADTNKDGKWDKAEWLAAGRREIGFNFIDSDKDGFVTQPELKSGMDRMKAMQSAQ